MMKSNKTILDRMVDHAMWSYFVIFVGEFTGTAFLLYFGCMGLRSENFITPSLSQFNISDLDLHDHPGFHELRAAFVWGTTITGVIMLFGHITRAHFNPAVTLSALILRLINPLTGLLYFVAHITGATFGYWILTVTLPKPLLGTLTEDDKSNGFCNTVLDPKMTVFQGILAEFVATSFLISAVCSAWDPRNTIWSDSVALKFGTVVTALVLGVGPLTGASLNPARSFAPALINGVWRNHWVYWIATLLASLVTTTIYKHLYLPEAEYFLKTKEQLQDKLQHGSLYSKQDDVDSLRPRRNVLTVETRPSVLIS